MFFPIGANDDPKSLCSIARLVHGPRVDARFVDEEFWVTRDVSDVLVPRNGPKGLNA